MNKIKIVDNEVTSYDNNNISVNDFSKAKYFNVKKNDIFIYIKDNISVDIELDCQYNTIEQNIVIVGDKYCNINLFEFKHGNKLIGTIRYILLDNACATINKFCNINEVNETTDILLNGINSKIDYNFSTLSNTSKIYNININHNNKYTNSNVICRGVSFDNAILQLNVNGTIDEGNSESKLNQDNRIMVFGNNKSIICPKLFISENDVEAKHAAVIGRFSNQELFYLKSRGIDEIAATKMLVKGFLLSPLNISNENKYEILKNINECWE
jgi:Fe-S cluster assembly scaffold protein SufB